VKSTVLRISTGDRLVTDLTAAVTEFCAGLDDGLLNVFVPHATAGLAIIETGSGTEDDLASLVDALLPAEDRYRHRHGTRGHGRDHVLPALVSPSVTVPVVAGRPAFGTWQSVVLVDSNVDNQVRQVRLSFVAG
jgi:secondary thiamine-phosphate synthase enzyme